MTTIVGPLDARNDLAEIAAAGADAQAAARANLGITDSGIVVSPGSLVGNPGTVPSAGANVAIGANLTLTADGTLNASGGGSDGVTSFNTRTGIVSLTSADVTGALGLTPVDASEAAAAAPVQTVAGRTGAVVVGTADISGFGTAAAAAAPVQSVAGRTGAVTLGTADISGFSAAAASAAPVQSVMGRTGAVTLGSADVTGALGFTAYSAANPSGYLTAATQEWTAGAVSVVLGGSISGGTLTISSGGGGSVTSVVAGAGLAGGTISVSGTISLGSTAAGSLVGNAGTAAAVAGAIAVGTNLTLSPAGTLSASSGISTTLAAADILVGNASGVATAVAMTGDAAISNAGSVTVSKIGGKAVTLAGALTTVGAFSTTLTASGATALTLPTSGTVATTANIATALPISTGALLGNNGAAGATSTIAIGANLAMISGTLSGNAGTVTSIVAGTNLTGGTITGAGTVALATSVSGLTSISSATVTATATLALSGASTSGNWTIGSGTTVTATGAVIAGTPNFSGAATGQTASAGDNSTKLATTAYVYQASTQVASINIGTPGTITLTAAQYQCPVISLTGTLTGNVTLLFPNSGYWFIDGSGVPSSGSSISAQTSGGAAVSLGKGYTSAIFANGTNCEYAVQYLTNASLINTNINWGTLTNNGTISGGTLAGTITASGMLNVTGTGTATTQGAGDNSTKLATTAYAWNQQSGLTTLSTLTGSTTLSAAQYSVAVLVATGTLTGNVTYILPNTGEWACINSTAAGGNTVTFKTAAGSGVTVGSGLTPQVLCANGTNVVSITSTPYLIAPYFDGVPGGSQVVVFHRFAQAAFLPANFGTTNNGEASYATSLIASTGSTTFTVSKCPSASDPTSGSNFTAVGTIVFSSGGHVGTLSTSGAAYSFAQGDYIKITAPGSPDATLANVQFSIALDR